MSSLDFAKASRAARAWAIVGKSSYFYIILPGCSFQDEYNLQISSDHCCYLLVAAGGHCKGLYMPWQQQAEF